MWVLSQHTRQKIHNDANLNVQHLTSSSCSVQAPSGPSECRFWSKVLCWWSALGLWEALKVLLLDADNFHICFQLWHRWQLIGQSCHGRCMWLQGGEQMLGYCISYQIPARGEAHRLTISCQNFGLLDWKTPVDGSINCDEIKKPPGFHLTLRACWSTNLNGNDDVRTDIH